MMLNKLDTNDKHVSHVFFYVAIVYPQSFENKEKVKYDKHKTKYTTNNYDTDRPLNSDQYNPHLVLSINSQDGHSFKSFKC